jgi:hypothetical protein
MSDFQPYFVYGCICVILRYHRCYRRLTANASSDVDLDDINLNISYYDPLLQHIRSNKIYCQVYRCDCRRGSAWWMDLLTTYTHDPELQAITAPPLISTIHKSPQHPLSLFQPAVFSSAVSWQRLLTVEIIQLHAVRFHLHSLPCRTQLNWLSQSQSYFTTGGLPPISSSWRQAPWDPRPLR